MMQIQLNNQQISAETNITLAGLLEKNNYCDAYFAVAINRQFIPRVHYATTLIQEGDHIEIITPMQGG